MRLGLKIAQWIDFWMHDLWAAAWQYSTVHLQRLDKVPSWKRLRSSEGSFSTFGWKRDFARASRRQKQSYWLLCGDLRSKIEPYGFISETWR